MKNIFIILLLIFFLFGFNIYAQDIEEFKDTPLWLKIDNAIQKVETNETGEALFQFRKILEKYPGNPESEMWIGIILNQENEYELAIENLELALEHKKQLVILEDQYQILYKLAEIYYKLGDYNSYTDTLKKVIEYSGEGTETDRLKLVMIDTLEKRGYDKFIELYRPMSKISLKAYSLLGKYYYDINNWNLSIEYLLQATGAILSSTIEEIKNIDPYYNFLLDDSTDKSLENVFNLVKKYAVLKKYFEDTSFYEYFYYLGNALKNTGKIESGSYILEKLYLRPESGKWGSLSNPF